MKKRGQRKWYPVKPSRTKIENKQLELLGIEPKAVRKEMRAQLINVILERGLISERAVERKQVDEFLKKLPEGERKRREKMLKEWRDKRVEVASKYLTDLGVPLEGIPRDERYSRLMKELNSMFTGGNALKMIKVQRIVEGIQKAFRGHVY